MCFSFKRFLCVHFVIAISFMFRESCAWISWKWLVWMSERRERETTRVKRAFFMLIKWNLKQWQYGKNVHFIFQSMQNHNVEKIHVNVVDHLRLRISKHVHEFDGIKSGYWNCTVDEDECGKWTENEPFLYFFQLLLSTISILYHFFYGHTAYSILGAFLESLTKREFLLWWFANGCNFEWPENVKMIREKKASSVQQSDLSI